MRLGSMAIVASWLLAVAGGAAADSIPLFSTGVDAGGSPLSGGSADPHWTIAAGTGIVSPTPAIVLSSPSGFYAVSGDSRWVWRNAGGSGGGENTFRLTFDLTGYDPTTAVLSGYWGTDNNGRIQLNGVDAVGTGDLALTGSVLSNFNITHAFTISGGFVAGLNTLDFVVIDVDSLGAFNARGLTLTATTSAVPEPQSLIALALGSIGMLTGFQARRALG